MEIQNSIEEQEIESSEITNQSLLESKQQNNWFSGNRGLMIGAILGITVGLGVSRVFSGESTAESTTESQSVTPIEIQSQSQSTSVTIATASITPISRQLKATGSVTAYESIPVSSQATGLQIKQIFVDEGDRVQQGQLLVQLNDAVLQAQLAQAKAQQEEAESRLAELLAGTREEEIARAQENVAIVEAQILEAESSLDLANKRVERNSNLEAEGAIARDRLDEVMNQQKIQESAIRQIQARLREAKQQLQELEKGPRPEVISQARAQLAHAKAQVQMIQAQLQDTKVISPVSGIISQRQARVGDITSSNEELFTIIENGRLELRLSVPETQLSSIAPGQKVEIQADFDPNLQLLGTIREINPTLDEESRQATVKVDLPGVNSLKPGMFLQGLITTKTFQTLTIPMGAVLPQSNNNAIVFVVQPDNTVKEQVVNMGEILKDNRIEIKNGLQKNDRVVVKGAPYLKDGDRIQESNLES